MEAQYKAIVVRGDVGANKCTPAMGRWSGCYGDAPSGWLELSDGSEGDIEPRDVVTIFLIKKFDEPVTGEGDRDVTVHAPTADAQGSCRG